MWLISLVMVFICLANVAGACPSCKLIEDPIAKGFNWSVLFLMATPFAVFGVIGGSIFYAYRRANKNDE
jgi:hypothetical protein